jgi:hypothetical protein
MTNPITTVKIRIPWSAPDAGFRVLVLSRRLGAFLDECASGDARLIQARPFRLCGSTYTTLSAAPVPSFSSGAQWRDLDCETVRTRGAPSLKHGCGAFPNPKIFMRLVTLGGLYGFGAYIVWLRRTAATQSGARLALRYHTRLVGLMRAVFLDGQIIVHNTDVRYFHLKAPKPDGAGGPVVKKTLE